MEMFNSTLKSEDVKFFYIECCISMRKEGTGGIRDTPIKMCPWK